MKKSLLALAVLGAFATVAQAQTNVSIGGVLQANVKSYKISSSARTNLDRETRIDDDYTSRFWLTGTEDLGGGLSALFYVENRIATDTGAAGTGSGLANGDTFLGLKGGFGQVTLGRHSMMAVQGLTTEILTGTGTITAMPTSMFTTYSVLNQFGTAAGTAVAGTANAYLGSYLDTTRKNNSIMYRTPNLSGFSGSIGIVAAGSTSSAASEGSITSGANPTANYSEGREYYAQAGYANGPLSLSLAYRNMAAEGRVATSVDEQQMRFSGFYKIGGFKAGLQFDRAQRELVSGLGGDATRNAWAIPVSFGFGSNTILAAVAKANDISGNAAFGAGRDTGVKMYTLGWDYALSKRTNVGVYYSRLDNDRNGAYQPFFAGTTLTGSSLIAGETASTFAMGVKHTF